VYSISGLVKRESGDLDQKGIVGEMEKKGFDGVLVLLGFYREYDDINYRVIVAMKM